MKYTLFIILFLVSGNLFGEIDITSNGFYIRNGFDEKWLTVVPDENNWKKVMPRNLNGDLARSGESYFTDVPRHTFLSLKEYPPQSFTYLSVLNINNSSMYNDGMILFIPMIGVNWEIYLNGNLIRKEVFIEDGKITRYRVLNDVSILLNPRYLKEKDNILAFRIIGDPCNQDTGFPSGKPITINSYEEINSKNHYLFSQ